MFDIKVNVGARVKTTFLVPLIAVAVKAIMFTLGSTLQTSPRLENAVRNESHTPCSTLIASPLNFSPRMVSICMYVHFMLIYVIRNS